MSNFCIMTLQDQLLFCNSNKQQGSNASFYSIFVLLNDIGYFYVALINMKLKVVVHFESKYMETYTAKQVKL